MVMKTKINFIFLFFSAWIKWNNIVHQERLEAKLKAFYD